MSKLLKITSLVYVEVPDDADPENVAGEFASGFEQAVNGFPGGDVVDTDVEHIAVVSEEEAKQRGLTE